MKIQIYENGTVRETLKRCLEDCKKLGGEVASLTQINQLIREGKIPKKFYDTRTTNFEYELRDLSMEELENIESFYEKGGRLLFLVNTDVGLSGVNDLGIIGRFVRVGVRDAKKGMSFTEADKMEIRRIALEKGAKTEDADSIMNWEIVDEDKD